MKIRCLLSILLLVLPRSAPGQDSRLLPADSFLALSGWPANHEARLSVREQLLGSLRTAPLPGSGRILLQPETGSRVKFQILTQNNARYYLFLNETAAGYPIAARGNMIIKRSLEDGRFLQLKVFFRDRDDCFIRLFPQGSRCALDVFLLGHKLYQRVMLPLSFETLITAPFRQVIQLTAAAVDWPLLLHTGEGEADSRVEQVLQGIRPLLPGLPDFDDGAMDKAGRFVRIEDGLEVETGGLNCSGFAKWVVDGFYYPLTGRLLDPEALKEKHVGLRGNRWSDRYEEERDPYFGLDWSRNLALALAGARAPHFPGDPESCDVRESLFLRYTEDVGYPVRDLELLLYLESREHPGYIYIGSLNRDTGTNPALRQHFHLIVLFPYFDRRGSFRLAVLERNVETGLSSVLERYAADYVHLVRLDARGEFLPAFSRN
jgi:hypothetical protein